MKVTDVVLIQIICHMLGTNCPNMTSSGEDGRVQNASKMPDDDLLVKRKTWWRFPLFLCQPTSVSLQFVVWMLQAVSQVNKVHIFWELWSELWSLKVGQNSLLHEIHKALYVYTF